MLHRVSVVLSYERITHSHKSPFFRKNAPGNNIIQISCQDVEAAQFHLASPIDLVMVNMVRWFISTSM